METSYGKNVKVCKHGLNDIWINGADGRVRMCGWTNYFVGNLSEQTIEEIWHGDLAEKFRESLLDGSYRYCNHGKCPYCANEMLEEHLVAYKIPEYPTSCNLSYQLQCNYVCRFCREEHYVPTESEQQKYRKIENELTKMLPFLEEIAANGAGELFCSESILNVLEKAELAKDVKVSLETNGSLFNERNWDRIKKLGDYHLTIYVTVHSFQEDTYQYLSGTKLPVSNVISNLHFLSLLREKDIINHLEVATVVCERNFREIPDYVKKCIDEFNVDRIRLRFFEPYGVMPRDVEWFYDIRNPFHPYHSEFVKVMENPILKNEKIWKWQGECMSMQKESPYVLERRNYNCLAEWVLLNNESEIIVQYLKFSGYNKVALFCAGNCGKAYVKLLREYGVDIRVIFDNYSRDEKIENDVEIKTPNENRVNEYDLILITQNVYYVEIKEELERFKYKGQTKTMDCFLEDVKCFISK